MTSEIDCPVCLRRHEFGPCPPCPEIQAEPEAVSPKTAQPEDPESLESLLGKIQSRIGLIPDAPERVQSPIEPGTCEHCGAVREIRTVHRYDGNGMSPRSRYTQEPYCRICDLCADVPASFRGLRFGTQKLAGCVRKVGCVGEAQAATKTRRVLIVGPGGHGKSSLLAAMVRARAELKGERNAFVTAWKLGVARAQHGLGEGEPELVQWALKAPVLALDDVGSESQLPNSAVRDVVFERHAQGQPMWITTAMTRSDVVSRYGDGMARRISEGARVINCGIEGECSWLIQK